MRGFNWASKRVAERVARDLSITTMQGRKFAVAPTRNDYGDTFLGRWDDEMGRFACIAACAPNGRTDPLGDLFIDDKPAIPERDWQPVPNAWS